MTQSTADSGSAQNAADGTPRLLFTPECGTGPGLLLLTSPDTPEAAIHARATLLAEEGYTVFAPRDVSDADGVAGAARALAARAEATARPVCVAHGDIACAAVGAAEEFAAIVAFDAPGLAGSAGQLASLPCPAVFQFGTLGSPAAAAAADTLRAAIDPGIGPGNGTRVHDWPDAAPGFALPATPAFDSRVDSLAHSRTLELIRRVVGPYYDYVALFAEHIRHEFETRDVDATMATMISDPYVNHVATLAGGVGHDMLKRFYKYHFVDQNSADRSSVTVSHTLGPDRVVLELVVRFKHDRVLDRYFPGIAPTGQYVELATVLIVKFRGDKVCHEHIYWDQGSALKQIGVLAADGLPVAGAEAARKVLDEHRPSNIFMADAWAASEDKPL